MEWRPLLPGPLPLAAVNVGTIPGLKVAQLRVELRSRDLDTRGLKAALVARLIAGIP